MCYIYSIYSLNPKKRQLAIDTKIIVRINGKILSLPVIPFPPHQKKFEPFQSFINYNIKLILIKFKFTKCFFKLSFILKIIF